MQVSLVLDFTLPHGIRLSFYATSEESFVITLNYIAISLASYVYP